MDLSLLNNDISYDILSRLPANMLVHSRCVSKGWQRLISDPEFIQLQMNKAEPAPISGYFFQEKFEYCDIDVEKLSYVSIGGSQTKIYQNILAFLPEKVVILGSSNGLICCRSCTPTSKPAVYICNPVNKEWITLELNKSRTSCDHIAFAFEPSNSVVAANYSTGCKLIRVSEVDNFTPGKEEFFFVFHIYDWRKEMWVKSKEVCFCEDSLCSNKWVIVKGVLYWLTDGHQVLMFDVENEFSLLISLPVPLTKDICPEICLGESDGELLHCIMVSSEALLVWVLVDRFSSKWDLKSSISLDSIEQQNPQFLCNLVERVSTTLSVKAPWMHPLAFKNGVLFLRISSAAYSFDIRNTKVRWLCNILDLGPDSFVGPIVVPYSMTLASLASA